MKAILEFPTGAAFIASSVFCDLRNNNQAYLITTMCVYMCPSASTFNAAERYYRKFVLTLRQCRPKS